MSKNVLPPVVLDYGTEVFYRGRRYTIQQESQDFRTVVLREHESGKLLQAPIDELSSVEALPEATQSDIHARDEEQQQDAARKFECIKPLLDNSQRSTQYVHLRAEELGLHFVTLYRWLKLFETTGKISVFLRKTRRDKGQAKLAPEVDKIVNDTIESFYLTPQKRKPSKVIREIEKLCAKAGLKAPHGNTVRQRIKALDAFKKTKAREGSKAARDGYAPIKGPFPGADKPLSVVQVDHTLVDIILVDDIHRLPIGRPWLTLLIDVFSRMVLGFYISFDPPGNLSLGLCLAQAFLPKEKWLAKQGIETAWPCWGVPRTIHADNAKEFRGNMMKMACKEYGIDLEWRPVATPHYGAHIERLLGTLNDEIHSAPGTTFSNPRQRGEYDSDARAVMSLAEFEKWFTILCVEIYHQRKHSELGMPPIAKWQEGVLGTKKEPGIGVPPRITDELRLKLDLMPYETRTVQHYGIIWDHIEYQHDVLRRWINSTDPDNPKNKRLFLCRRDPRDISTIWFYDPEVEQYYAIPYRNTSHPAISIWELREAKRRALEEQPKVTVDENLIFSAYDKMQSIEQSAQKLTKKMRRNQQRRRLGLSNAREHLPASTAPQVIPQSVAPSQPKVSIVPFEEVDDMADSGDRDG